MGRGGLTYLFRPSKTSIFPQSKTLLYRKTKHATYP